MLHGLRFVCFVRGIVHVYTLHLGTIRILIHIDFGIDFAYSSDRIMDDFNRDVNLPGGVKQQQPGRQTTFDMKKGFENSSSTSSSKKKKKRSEKKSSKNNIKQNAAVIRKKKDEGTTMVEKESEKEIKARMKKGKKLMKGEEFECAITHAGPAMKIPGQGMVLPTGVPSGFPLIRSAVYELMSHRGENVQYGDVSRYL